MNTFEFQREQKKASFYEQKQTAFRYSDALIWVKRLEACTVCAFAHFYLLTKDLATGMIL